MNLIIVENPSQEIISKLQSELDDENRLNSGVIIGVGGYVGIQDLNSVLPNFYIAIVDEGKPVAIVNVHFLEGDDDPELYKLYVIPDYRKNGVAMKLVDYTFEKLKQNGFEEVFVEMTTRSIPFWEKVAGRYEFEHFDYTHKLSFKLSNDKT